MTAAAVCLSCGLSVPVTRRRDAYQAAAMVAAHVDKCGGGDRRETDVARPLGEAGRAPHPQPEGAA